MKHNPFLSILLVCTLVLSACKKDDSTENKISLPTGNFEKHFPNNKNLTFLGSIFADDTVHIYSANYSTIGNNLATFHQSIFTNGEAREIHQTATPIALGYNQYFEGFDEQLVHLYSRYFNNGGIHSGILSLSSPDLNLSNVNGYTDEYFLNSSITHNEKSVFACKTSNRYVIAAGYQQGDSNPLNNSFKLYWLDKNAQYQSSNLIQIAGKRHQLRSITSDENNNLYLFGEAEDDLFTLKISNNGFLKWNKLYPKTQSEQIIHSVYLPNGNLVVLSSSFEQGSKDAVLTCYTTEGEEVWKYFYGNGLIDDPVKLILSNDNELAFISTVTNLEGIKEAMLTRLSLTGNILETKIYGHQMHEIPMDILQSETHFFITGITLTTTGIKEPFVYKYKK